MRSLALAFALVTLSLTGALTGEGVAHAGGYLTARYGADYGSPAMTNTFAVYYNPAALGGVRGTTIQGDASILLRSASYNRVEGALSPSNPSLLKDPNYVKSNTGSASLFNVAALPFLGVSTDFGGKLGGLRGGYAFYIPYGGSADWAKRTDDMALNGAVPGAIDGPQRWHNISGQILAIYNTVALAYELPAGFSIGASFSPVIHSAKTVRARNLDGSDDTLKNNILVEGRSLIEVSGFNVGAGFGIHYDPFDDHRFKIGVSYTTQPGFGDTTMSGTLNQQLGAAPGLPKDVDLTQAYPDIIRFGFSWQMAKQWELHSDFQYERWSVFKSQCLTSKGVKCNLDPTGKDLTGGNVILNVPANWHDSIGARLGTIFSATDNVAVFASTAFGTPAVGVETINAATIDAFRMYATLGARFQLGKHFSAAASYNHVFFLDVDTKGQSTLAKYPTPSASPSGDGVYKSTVGFFTLDAAYTF
jgi:long-chain fatty acid transport protein